MIQKIVLIGSGNVAWNLSHSLPLLGFCVVQIFDRKEDKAQRLALEIGADYTGEYDEIYDDADYYIYAISDDAIPEVINSVKITNGIHIHTSGCVSIDVFKDKKEQFGVLYPFQTFTYGKKVDFNKISIFIEGNNKNSLERIEFLANKLSLKVFDITSDERKKIHLSGVFGCNFTNYLWRVSQDILKENNLPFSDVMLPLIEESVEKLKYMSPKDAQTGPAIRRDAKTMDIHLQMLYKEPKLQNLYKEISNLIQSNNK